MKQNKSKILSIRVTNDDYETLKIISLLNKATVTSFLRQLLLKFLSLDFEKQEKYLKEG